jgi:hypothetical protein
MKNNYHLYFGDLHVHTHYSDNRDRASIEEMILAGEKYHLSIFGTADHHHNLDAKKWTQTLEETQRLREKYQDMLILNNCEITFLLGHLNVLVPQNIEGTIEEGYRYLYQDRHALKIVNHPFSDNDEWHQRILPDALGIEVINGSVFAEAQQQGYRIHSAIDISSVHTYATYLALGLPVAAIGGSDAHRKAELGFGMTGFWLDGTLDDQAVITAIREHRTFATTNSNISLDWSFNEKDGELSWDIHWKKGSSSKDDLTVEIYHGTRKIYTTNKNGKYAVNKAGLYWITGFDEGDIVISSPIHVNRDNSEKRHAIRSLHILQTALHFIHRDLTWLNMKPMQIFSQPAPVTFSQPVELQMVSGTDCPELIDADGKKVPYEIISKGTSRVIIDKTCDARGFDEFYLWLRRNEIHEYLFAKIQYQKINRSFWFKGYLLPKKMVHREGIYARYQEDLETLRTLVDNHTTIKVHVSILPVLGIKMHLNHTPFPLRVCDDFTDFTSLFYYEGKKKINCPGHILDRLEGWRYDGNLPLNERIYQVFV